MSLSRARHTNRNFTSWWAGTVVYTTLDKDHEVIGIPSVANWGPEVRTFEFPLWEYIQDNNNKKDRPESEVNHHKWLTEAFPDTHTYSESGECFGTYGSIDATYYGIRSTVVKWFYTQYGNYVYHAPPIGLESLYGDLVSDIMGGMNSSLLSLVTVGEILRGENIFSSVSSIARSLKSSLSRNRAFHKRAGDLARSELGKRFGVDSFMRDLKDMFDISKKINKQIRKLAWRNTKKTFTVSKGKSTTYTGSGYTVTTEDRLTATCSARYPLTESTYDALWRQACGFDKLMSTAWELVPFSFLIDYFIPIGDKISSFERKISDSKIGAEWSITGISHSRKSEMRRSCTYRLGELRFFPIRCNARLYQDVKFTARATRYTRYPIPLDAAILSATFNDQGVTANQWSTVGVLIASKL